MQKNTAKLSVFGKCIMAILLSKHYLKKKRRTNEKLFIPWYQNYNLFEYLLDVSSMKINKILAFKVFNNDRSKFYDMFKVFVAKYLDKCDWAMKMPSIVEFYENEAGKYFYFKQSA